MKRHPLRGGSPGMRLVGWFGAGAVVLLGLGIWLWTSRPATVPPTPPPEPGSSAWFRDVTEEVGLNFVHDPGPLGAYFFPQIMGSGAAFFDFDNDGRLDIYLVQIAGPDSRSTNRLFRQEPDGRFTDVTRGPGLDI